MVNKREKYILAIDLGTSGPKSALVSTRGEVVDYQFEDVELLILPDGGAEQRPQDWWQAIIRTLKAVLEKQLVSAEDIVAINCTSQWSGTVALDADGNHLMNAIIWLDTRGSPYVKSIADGLIKVEGYNLAKLMKWLSLTGGAPGQSGKDSIGHILFLKHEYPDIYQKTYKFLEPLNYLNFRFTGKYASSYDAMTLHWLTDNRDITNIQYHDGLLKMATVEREKFPDLKRPNEILGTLTKELARELGLSNEVQVVIGSPDVPCAAVGSGAVKDYDGHLYIGTSSWLTCHVPYKKTDIFHGIASLPAAIPGRYFVANEQETAGKCLTYLRDNILFHQDDLLVEPSPLDVFKIFDKIAASVPAGSNKVIFTPWLFGERTPVEDHSVRAAIFNQSLSTTREHIIRAVFEGVAYNTKWLLGYIEKFINQRMEQIRFIGGGAKSEVWCQILADVLDRDILQVHDPIKANIKGAAFLASAALGHINYDEIPALTPIDKTFKPDPQHRKIYDELFREFLNIYKANKKIYARLNRRKQK
ncbi:FGGY-family carbohydrate kinase [candidate division CSSED10-310 bacterium]|uniref:FGGY-family carbohydrate kinase n=1 Tax=candidate division CSSED10-310 bacterium TaxID=2855610 RepID=A0ABV6YV20_UNCC1